MAKAFRRAEREAAQQQDREALESAGLRVQRRSETLCAALAAAARCRDSGTDPDASRPR